uniref:Uncharacterized protein n=1 Tax=Mycena chlorophos TaxID=658473 RepID=A0ABQ0LHQ1_MYCCL|nr:predicted protein [Mycena chlorophos]
MDAATVQLQPAVYHQNKNVERSMASHPVNGKHRVLKGQHQRPEVGYRQLMSSIGGVGGHGGQAVKGDNGEGGMGGLGKGGRVPIGNVTLFDEIIGGHGGTGGEGFAKGGIGGVGEAPELINALIVQPNPAAGAAYLSIEDFCKLYRLSKAISKKLQEEGYEWTAALFQVSEHTLNEMFKGGQVAEIKRALGEYEASNLVTKQTVTVTTAKLRV